MEKSAPSFSTERDNGELKVGIPEPKIKVKKVFDDKKDCFCECADSLVDAFIDYDLDTTEAYLFSLMDSISKSEENAVVYGWYMLSKIDVLNDFQFDYLSGMLLRIAKQRPKILADIFSCQLFPTNHLAALASGWCNVIYNEAMEEGTNSMASANDLTMKFQKMNDLEGQKANLETNFMTLTDSLVACLKD
ncbi:MAG: hypothetical protein KDC92_12305 [Bacteroidetes bacterium]|nr:hypothetical protein [Bacteroidota bacterium]